MESNHRALAVLKLATTVPGLIKQLHAIILAMTNNVWFPVPNPVAKAAATLGLLETAEANVKLPGGAAARNVQRRAMTTQAQQLQSFVQGVADANPSQAEAIITSAGMLVRKVTPRQRHTLKATPGEVSGLVLLMAALAATKACYMWQWSLDQKNWTNITPVFRSTTTVSGLTSATLYYFRYRTITSAGESDWSQVVSVLVK